MTCCATKRFSNFFPTCSYSPFFICFECFREFSVADCTSFQFHESAALRLLRADDARDVVSFEGYEYCGMWKSRFLPGEPKTTSMSGTINPTDIFGGINLMAKTSQFVR